MPSLFPGMDPYLEGQVWREFHHEFMTAIRDALQPRLLPRYLALIGEHVYVGRTVELPGRRVEPDLAVLQDRTRVEEGSLSPDGGQSGTAL